MKIFNTILFLAITLLVITTSCNKEKTATVLGVVYSYNEKHTISHASVYVDDKNSGVSTFSGVDGSFELQVPKGNHTLYIETGDGTIFHTELSLDLKAGETVELTAEDTRLDQRAQLAFVAGAYDQIESIVQDSLGYTITQLFPAQLDQMSTISPYAAIFVNCGATTISSAADSNLGNYVAGGGSLYVSDYGVDYLIGEYDGTCNPPGGFLPDSLICTNRGGVAGIVPGVSITSPGLAAAMGTSAVDVNFNLGGWGVVVNYNTNFWDVMMNYPGYGPLLLHNHNWGGNSAGNIYLTAFHNEPNGTISQTAEQILTYVILNL